MGKRLETNTGRAYQPRLSSGPVDGAIRSRSRSSAGANGTSFATSTREGGQGATMDIWTSERRMGRGGRARQLGGVLLSVGVLFSCACAKPRRITITRETPTEEIHERVIRKAVIL